MRELGEDTYQEDSEAVGERLGEEERTRGIRVSWGKEEGERRNFRERRKKRVSCFILTAFRFESAGVYLFIYFYHHKPIK